MIIETKRLRIMPLELELFHLYLTDPAELGRLLNLTDCMKPMNKEMFEAMSCLYEEALQNENDYLWYTNWQIIRKSDLVSVGSACFVGKPDEKGEVVIGYGIDEEYRNNGYMTEAATAMHEWALSQEGVKNIVAETSKFNVQSHRVLQKCGMKKYDETLESYFWKLK